MSVQGDIGTLAKAEVKKLGIDVASKYVDIRKLVSKFFTASKIDPEDLLQEVLLAIVRRNGTPSAFNPAKSSFSHYVLLVAKNAISNYAEKRRRWDLDILGLTYRVGSDAYTDADPETSAVEELADHRDPIGAFEHVESSLRLVRTRPLNRNAPEYIEFVRL
jgi:DNA-directed RNA polymerase specialized sigma24 family protein